MAPVEPSEFVDMVAGNMAAEVVAAGLVAAEERDVDVATVVAEKSDAGLAVAVAVAWVSVGMATVAAGKPGAGLAAAVVAAEVDADVATVAAEIPDAGLSAAVCCKGECCTGNCCGTGAYPCVHGAAGWYACI